MPSPFIHPSVAPLWNNQSRKTSWEERQSKKRRRDEMKDLERQMQERNRSEKLEAKQKREERLAERQANAMKGTTMQTITKTHKLKTMNKKQLRQIKKTQVNSRTGQVELVSPWAK
uniref:Coiled-coil domain-containing protein 86 n=1 Tax=Rhizochromulina marina TaxID=1034831 RepID=A0A7S2SQP8_9STRA|mmetsp:Transcript_4520/g.13535  ORF Transcript_4520/g.13535 Transcript_4520/m.13535 type:complete len:116 (+) Transcript_4520:127-474(+)